MCAPLLEPGCASYIEALTRTSSRTSGAGVGMALPMARYTDAALGTTPPAALLAWPVLLTTRNESTWLVVLPLNRLLASTPFSRKALDVSRWPLAQMGELPSPELAPVPPGSSALTPGD